MRRHRQRAARGFWPTVNAVLKSASGAASAAPARETSAVAPCATAVVGTVCAATSVPLRAMRSLRAVGCAGVSVSTSRAAIERLRCASTPASVGGAVRQARSLPFTVVFAFDATARPTVAPESRPTAIGASMKWS